MNESLPLYQQLQAGNTRILTLLNDSQAEGLYRALSQKGITLEDFHEIFNDALLAIWERRDRFNSNAHVYRTLHQITRFLAANRQREQYTRKGQALRTVLFEDDYGDVLPTEPPVQEWAEWQARMDHYTAAFGQLTELEAKVINLIYRQGRKPSEVARELGDALTTVTTIRDRALKKLQAYLSQYLTADMIDQAIFWLPLLWILFSTFLKNF